MHIVGSKHLPMSECIKQNFDLAARFLIARNIAPAELCKHLNESMKQNRNHISKAIGWSITKQLYKVIQTKDNINRVIDVWPGYRCRCNRHCTKSHSRICSSEAVIIVEVDLFSNTIQGDYYGIPIEQSFQVVDDELTQVQYHDEMIDSFSPSYIDVQMPTLIPGKIAEKCFKQHSKLTMIYIHPLRKTIIQLCCQKKGVIPMGEQHFPKAINGMDTHIVEGHVRFMAKIQIGDSICQSGSHTAGTLGGFVQMRGLDAFLTCAHVVHNKETLIAGNKRELHKSQTKVEFVKFACDDISSSPKLYAGFVFDEAFDYDNGNETSVDAAVVLLHDDIYMDKDDILNDRSFEPKPVEFLGIYINFNCSVHKYIIYIDLMSGNVLEYKVF